MNEHQKLFVVETSSQEKAVFTPTEVMILLKNIAELENLIISYEHDKDNNLVYRVGDSKYEISELAHAQIA